MKLRDRMAGIDANLDDLQSGLEASSRTADALHDDAAGFALAAKRMNDAPVIRSLVRLAAELQADALEQRGVLQELRDAIVRLQEELKISTAPVRPPPLSTAADRSRR